MFFIAIFICTFIMWWLSQVTCDCRRVSLCTRCLVAMRECFWTLELAIISLLEVTVIIHWYYLMRLQLILWLVWLWKLILKVLCSLTVLYLFFFCIQVISNNLSGRRSCSLGINSCVTSFYYLNLTIYILILI